MSSSGHKSAQTQEFSGERTILKIGLFVDGVILTFLIAFPFTSQLWKEEQHEQTVALVLGVSAGLLIPYACMINLFFAIQNLESEPTPEWQTSNRPLTILGRSARLCFLVINGKLIYIGIVLYLFYHEVRHAFGIDLGEFQISGSWAWYNVKRIFIWGAGITMAIVIAWDMIDFFACRKWLKAQKIQGGRISEAWKRVIYFGSGDLCAVISWVCIVRLLRKNHDGEISGINIPVEIAILAFFALLYALIMLFRQTKVAKDVFQFEYGESIYK